MPEETSLRTGARAYALWKQFYRPRQKKLLILAYYSFLLA